MSRSVAAALQGIISAIIAPQSPRRRAMTVSRLIERLDRAGAHTIQTPCGPIGTLPLRGPHLAAAALAFDEEEPEMLAWMDEFQPGEVFYDVGAATGLFSMYAARRPDVAVYAFEPKATSLGVLVEHLALNGLAGRVFPLAVALSDRTEATSLSLSALAPGSGGNSVGGAPDQFGLTRSVFDQGVLAYRLDDLIAAFNLPPPTRLKIDVDGAEGPILQGAPKALVGVDSVMIEVEGENAREADVRLDPYLKAAGLTEETDVRAQGSKRNRLYRRG